MTYAMKSKRILNNYGYYCEIEKTPKELANGCGHSLRVHGDGITAGEILRKNGVPIKASLTIGR